MTLQTGQQFPEGVVFNYVPIDLSTVAQDTGLSCDRPIKLQFDQLIANNKDTNIAVVFVPGAFTPTCSEVHIPDILKKITELKKEKNVGVVVIASANDAFVINAWGKLLLKQANIVSNDPSYPKIIFASDPNAEFSHSHDAFIDGTAGGLGIRTARYAFVINAESKKITYFGKEDTGDVVKSGIEALLSAKL